VSIADFFALFEVQTSKPDLVQAQIKALSKQVSLLFFITVVNTLALAATHYGVAPDGLTIIFPMLITIGYFWRGLEWAKLSHTPISDADAGRLLKLTVILGPGCTAILVVWTLVIFQYGDAYAQGHVVFYVGVTIFLLLGEIAKFHRQVAP